MYVLNVLYVFSKIKKRDFLRFYELLHTLFLEQSDDDDDDDDKQ